MDQLSRMHVLECFEKLVDDELFVDFLEDARTNDDMQIWIVALLPVSM